MTKILKIDEFLNTQESNHMDEGFLQNIKDKMSGLTKLREQRAELDKKIGAITTELSAYDIALDAVSNQVDKIFFDDQMRKTLKDEIANVAKKQELILQKDEIEVKIANKEGFESQKKQADENQKKDKLILDFVNWFDDEGYDLLRDYRASYTGTDKTLKNKDKSLKEKYLNAYIKMCPFSDAKQWAEAALK